MLETVQQAVRASSAAPYYLDDYGCGEDRFQDGAAIANNPSVLALQQARLLWPDAPIELLVSLGCGLGPQVCAAVLARQPPGKDATGMGRAANTPGTHHA